MPPLVVSNPLIPTVPETARSPVFEKLPTEFILQHTIFGILKLNVEEIILTSEALLLCPNRILLAVFVVDITRSPNNESGKVSPLDLATKNDIIITISNIIN
jgi:hypothetical protein